MVRQPVFLIAVCTLLSSITMAEPPAKDLLAGPTMHDEAITNMDMALEAQRVSGRNINNAQKQKFWMATLKTLDLAKEQQTRIQGLIEEFELKEKEFQKFNGKEISKLRRESSAARKEGGEVPRETRAKLLELLSKAPAPILYYERAWAMLTFEQQEEFKKRYQQRIAKALQERLERERKNQTLMEGGMKERGFGPEDSPFRDKGTTTKEDPS